MDFNSVIVTVECITIPPCPAETERDRGREARETERGQGGRTRCPSLVALYVATVRASALSRVERAGGGPGGGAGRGAVDSCVSSHVARAPRPASPPDAARPPLSRLRGQWDTESASVRSLPET